MRWLVTCLPYPEGANTVTAFPQPEASLQMQGQMQSLPHHVLRHHSNSPCNRDFPGEASGFDATHQQQT